MLSSTEKSELFKINLSKSYLEIVAGWVGVNVPMKRLRFHGFPNCHRRKKGDGRRFEDEPSQDVTIKGISLLG
jgi:hypothetical protein